MKSKKRGTYPPAKTYIPKKLRRRLHDYAEDPKVGSQVGMSHKPGSQNPRKSGPRRNSGV